MGYARGRMEPSWAGRWVRAGVIGWVVARCCTRRELWFPTSGGALILTVLSQSRERRVCPREISSRACDIGRLRGERASAREKEYPTGSIKGGGPRV
jgi:hypothetical protein